jgi:formamidopyrimidine-DNA glycosylase
MVRGIRPFVVARKLTALRRCRTACRPITFTPSFPTMARGLVGHTVRAVRRLGKRIVLDFDHGAALAIEPRMTGLLLLADPPDRQHLRLEFEFDGEAEYRRVWFWDRRGLGTVQLFRAGELERWLQTGRLGPDALEMTPESWTAALRRTRRAVKVALLDQRLVAGIGNLYASEILHRAAIHPLRPSHSLTSREIDRLQRAARIVLEDAVRYEGSTLGDGTYRNALNRSGGYQNVHQVYQKEGRSCPRCRRGVIQRLVQAQRSTFFCPRCQQ